MAEEALLAVVVVLVVAVEVGGNCWERLELGGTKGVVANRETLPTNWFREEGACPERRMIAPMCSIKGIVQALALSILFFCVYVFVFCSRQTAPAKKGTASFVTSQLTRTTRQRWLFAKQHGARKQRP